MKLLFLVSSMHAGGAERVAATLANAWAARGVSVTLLCCYSGRGRCDYPLDASVQILWLADRLRGPRALYPALKILHLRQLMKEIRPDRVLSFLGNVNVQALVASRGLGLPVVVSERSDPLHSINLPASLRAMRRRVYPWAHAVVVQTPQSVAHLQQVVPGLRRICVVPNPLSPDLSAPRTQEPDSDRRVLAALGRFNTVKQFAHLIELFATLAPRHPDWDLCIWGEGPERAQCQALVRRLGLQARVFLPGHSPTPWDDLQHSHGFVLSSRVEGFPNALLEAMALGLPCVAYDCPSGPAELTRNGNDARLVPLNDPAAMIAALDTLMSASAEQRLQWGLRAAASVRSRYGLATVLGLWDDVWQPASDLLGTGSPVLGEEPSGRAAEDGACARSAGQCGSKAASGAESPSSQTSVPAAGMDHGRPGCDDSAARPLVMHVISGLHQGGAETVLYRLVTAHRMNGDATQADSPWDPLNKSPRRVDLRNQAICRVADDRDSNGAKEASPHSGQPVLSLDQAAFLGDSIPVLNDAARFRHVVVSLGDAGVMAEAMRAAGVEVICLRMHGARGIMRGAWRLWQLLRQYRPDVVQTWMYHADFLGGCMARLAGCRAVAWGLRNSGSRLSGSSRMARLLAWVNARLSHWVPGVIVACGEKAANIHAGWGYRRDRLRVIPNGYNMSDWRPDPKLRQRMRAELALAQGRLVLGSVARWDPQKDHENLLAALALLRRTRDDFCCVLVGSGMSHDNTALLGRLRHHGLQDHVLLLGRRDDVPAIMQAMDIHVLPSRAEGFPNVVCEAMASGLACVVTDAGDAAAIVNGYGWVAPIEDAPALARAIAEAADAIRAPGWPEQRQAARASVAQRYSLARMVQAYEIVWEQLLADTGVSRSSKRDQSTSRMPACAEAKSSLRPDRSTIAPPQQDCSVESGEPVFPDTAVAKVQPQDRSRQIGGPLSSGGQQSAADDPTPTESAALRPPARLLFFIANPEFFLSHRLPIALAAQAAGYEVHVASMGGAAVKRIQALGLEHHALPLSRTSMNPVLEARSLYALWRLLRRLQPDLLHAVTLKSVLYGGMASRAARVPAFVAAISGLGYVFIDEPGLRRRGLRQIALLLYRLALGHSHSRVIFQNESDQQLLLQAGVVRAQQCVLFRGSGVDLQKFRPMPWPDSPVTVTLAARLLRDKGVLEFVAAARASARQETGIRWCMAGSPDPENPASVSATQLKSWVAEGILDYIGECADVAALYARSHIVVLPSYREGLPKSLIEAAASGRPVITSDVPGCRDAIEAGTSGLLVPVRDAQALLAAVQRLAADPALRERMGAAGRALAERDFDLRVIVQQHLELYADLLDRPGSSADRPRR